MKRMLLCMMAALLGLAVTACGGSGTAQDGAKDNTRIFIDGAGREVEIPETVESVICVDVGALRYTVYMGAQDLVVGVEDYEVEQNIYRLYNYTNFETFKDLPIIGNNGEQYIEEIIRVSPEVIVMAGKDGSRADALQNKTGIPVVLVPGSDTTLDDNAYETFRLMGELYGREDRAEEITAYCKALEADLTARTANITEHPSVYVGCVAYKGYHGIEGTEAGYGPLAMIGARNLANETKVSGAFDCEKEQLLVWDPDIIFLDYTGLSIFEEQYAENPEFFDSLTAVREGRVYAQIPFRSFASNLETALADTYYAAAIIYPEAFADIDIEAKTREIFTEILGVDAYDTLKENGYEFKALTLRAQ